MKISKILVSTLIAFGLGFSCDLFAETSVIIHPSNGSSLDQDTVNKIYLGKTKSFSNGSSVIAINLKEGLPIRTGFDKAILNKSASQVKSYWSKLLFTGKGTPPQEVGSDAEMIALISTNPSAIGYVDSGAVTGDVKVLFTF